MSIYFPEAGLSVVATNFMCPAVCVAPIFSFLVHCGFWLLGGLALQIALVVFNLPLQRSDSLLHCCHGGVLGGHMIVILRYLGQHVHVGASELSHCRLVLFCCLSKVCESFLNSKQFV